MNRGFSGVLTVLWSAAALAEPARPGVNVDRLWLVPVEDTGIYEAVADPLPEGTGEALYSVRFRYDGEADAEEGLEIIQRMPVGMLYVPGSATGPGAVVTFSVDGGESYDIPEALSVREDGDTSRPATADDYTHIRWLLPGRFPPGLSGVVSFRARQAEAGAELQTEADTESPGATDAPPPAEPAPADEGR